MKSDVKIPIDLKDGIYVSYKSRIFPISVFERPPFGITGTYYKSSIRLIKVFFYIFNSL